MKKARMTFNFFTEKYKLNHIIRISENVSSADMHIHSVLLRIIIKKKMSEAGKIFDRRTGHDMKQHFVFHPFW